jgi:hypothetical protein
MTDKEKLTLVRKNLRVVTKSRDEWRDDFFLMREQYERLVSIIETELDPEITEHIFLLRDR